MLTSAQFGRQFSRHFGQEKTFGRERRTGTSALGILNQGSWGSGDHLAQSRRTQYSNSRSTRWSDANLRSGVFFFVFFFFCFFGSRGKKKNAWYIYLTSSQPPSNLHDLPFAWPIMFLANKRLPNGNQILARIMSLLKSVLGKKIF